MAGYYFDEYDHCCTRKQNSLAIDSLCHLLLKTIPVFKVLQDVICCSQVHSSFWFTCNPNPRNELQNRSICCIIFLRVEISLSTSAILKCLSEYTDECFLDIIISTTLYFSE